MWSNVYTLEELGDFFRRARKEKGFRQEDFAKRIGTSHATLSRFEQGGSTTTAVFEKAMSHLGYRIVVAPRTAQVVVQEAEDA